MKKRTVALLCAAVALLGVIFGGTMAWLNRGTAPVVNTFTTANVGLDLTETDREYIMAPGAVLDKDPKVIVDKDSASSYLFVVVNEVNFDKDPITWTADPGWKKVEGLDKQIVYYREFDEKNPGTLEKVTVKDENGKNVEKEAYVFPFLKDNQVIVSEDLKQPDMDAYKEAGRKETNALDAYPQLVFTAYAIQRDYLKDADGNPIPKNPENPTNTEIVAIYRMAVKQTTEPTVET